MPQSTSLRGVAPFQLRGLAWLTLTDTGYIHTRGGTDNTGGGYSETWTAGTVATPCRVDPIGARTGEVAEQVDERSTHVITVPPDTNLAEADRFVVTNRGTFEATEVRRWTDGEVKRIEAIKF